MTSNLDVFSEIDDILLSYYPSDKPGAAVLVVKDSNVVFRKGYGLANIELQVPVEPQMIFRIGSITKQFTAVSILMLSEQDKLNLQDDITRFLPDFPTRGRIVTIENLLTHTSGIKEYTDEPQYQTLARQDSGSEMLFDIIKNLPFLFEPGEQFDYSNSGYYLLGLIIEKVAGMKYYDFFQEYIFKPLNMIHSYQENLKLIITGRVAGYSNKNNTCANAICFPMSNIYADGSISTNVDDLALWDAALYTSKLIKPETLAQAFKPFTLKNGESTLYGYGWAIFEYQGVTFIEHSGGVDGFAASGLRIPDERVYIAILTNNEDAETEPMLIAKKLGGLIIGKPVKEPIEINVAEDVLESYVGVYRISDQATRTITREGKQLFSQRSGSPKFEIFSYAEDAFFFKVLNHLFFFERNNEGNVTGMRVVQHHFGPPERARLLVENSLAKS